MVCEDSGQALRTWANVVDLSFTGMDRFPLFFHPDLRFERFPEFFFTENIFVSSLSTLIVGNL